MKTLLLGAAVLAFAACGSSGSDDPNDPNDPTDPNDPNDPTDPTTPDQADLDYADVAALVGQSAARGESWAMLDVMVLSHGGTPDGFVVTPGDHYLTAAGSRAGVTFDYYYHCNDNADVVLTYCDATVNHAHVQVTMTGSATGAAASLSAIDRDGDWTVREISVAKPRIGGDAMMQFTASVAGQYPATYTLSYTANFDRVRYTPGTTLPLSGKIDFSISANRTRAGAARNFSVTAALVFDGDSSATLTLDATRNYSVDLTTGATLKL
jgi:hypothetical protein